MTWKAIERSAGDNTDPLPGTSAANGADLSAGIWSRASGCHAGCGCGGCNRREVFSIQDQIFPDPVNGRLESATIDLSDLMLPSNKYPPSRPPYTNRFDTTDQCSSGITVSNGDRLVLGTGGPHNFNLVTSSGDPVRIVERMDADKQAYDAPIRYALSNGAVYTTRGGWNHDESITWPNGDVVQFTDAGVMTSYTRGQSKDLDPTILGQTTGKGDPYPDVFKPLDQSSKNEVTFANGDRFNSLPNGWELVTTNGEKVTQGKPDPNSPMDATRIPLSNGATLVSGGWGVDTITYPDGESISFGKDGKVRSQSAYTTSTDAKYYT